MSVEAMAIALHHSQTDNPTTKWVLMGIANHDGDGGSWPSIATLAKYALCSERTAQRAVRELETLGEVKVEAQAGGLRNWRSDRRPNLYRFLLRCPPNCDRSTSHKLDEQAAAEKIEHPSHGVTPMSPRRIERGDADVAPLIERGDTGDRDGVTPATERGDTAVSPEPSLEPSMEEGAGARAERALNRPAPPKPPADNRTRLDRCTRHQLDVDAPPCGPCADANRGALAAEQARHRAAGIERSRAALAAAQTRQADIDRCQMCDDSGYRGRAVCDHDPNTADRAARHIAEARAALTQPHRKAS